MTYYIRPGREICFRPSSQRVTNKSPHYTDERDHDKNLKIIEIYQAVRVGKLPTNAQIDRFLFSIIHSPVIEKQAKKLSPDGQRLLSSFKDLLHLLKRTLREKNRDELIQSFVYHIHLTQKNASRDGALPSQEFTSEVQGGFEATFTIIRLFVTNAAFRVLAQEFLVILKDMFGKSMQDILKPSEETRRLRKRTAGVGMVDHRHERADNTLEEETDVFRMESQTRERVDSGVATNSSRRPSNAEHLQSGSEIHSSREANNADKKQESDELDTGSTFHGRIGETIPKTAKIAADFVREKLPAEKIDELVDRLKIVLDQLQKHPDYQNAVDTIFNAFFIWSLMDLAADPNDVRRNLYRDANWLQAAQEFGMIVEDFLGQSVQSFKRSLKEFVQDVNGDEQLKQYCKEVTHYLKRLLKERGYIDTRHSNEQGTRLICRGRELLGEKYTKHLDRLLSDASELVNGFQGPLMDEFIEKIKAIHNAMWSDEEGNIALKPQLLNDIRATLIPTMLEQMKFIPIPRVEYSDPEWDIVLENITLSSECLVPNIIETKVKNYFRFSSRSEIENTTNRHFTINMSQIQLRVEDIIFYYRHKRGLLQLSDRGIANVLVGGKGISLQIKLGSGTEAGRLFNIRKVKCDVGNLKITVHHSRYDALYKAFYPLLVHTIERQIACGIERQVYDWLWWVDTHLASFAQLVIPKNIFVVDGGTSGAIIRFVNVLMGTRRKGKESTNRRELTGCGIDGSEDNRGDVKMKAREESGRGDSFDGEGSAAKAGESEWHSRAYDGKTSEL